MFCAEQREACWFESRCGVVGALCSVHEQREVCWFEPRCVVADCPSP